MSDQDEYISVEGERLPQAKPKPWYNYVSHKQTAVAAILLLFYWSDLLAKYDDIFESMITIVSAAYLYFKSDKKSQMTTNLLAKLSCVIRHDKAGEDIAQHSQKHGELDRRNYFKRKWPWPLIAGFLLAAGAMELAYGVLTILAVEKTLNKRSIWLKALLTFFEIFSTLVLLAASVLGTFVSLTYYEACELKRKMANQPEIRGRQQKSTDVSETSPLLPGVVAPKKTSFYQFLDAFKAWDVKSWGFLFFIVMMTVSELLNVWNKVSSRTARTLGDTELLVFLFFYATEMFFNMAEIPISREHLPKDSVDIKKCYFAETKTGVALSILSIVIPLIAKFVQTILFALSDEDPGNLNVFECKASNCGAMTALTVAGIFTALPAVGVNHQLEKTRRKLYEASVPFFQSTGGQGAGSESPVAETSVGWVADGASAARSDEYITVVPE